MRVRAAALDPLEAKDILTVLQLRFVLLQQLDFGIAQTRRRGCVGPYARP